MFNKILVPVDFTDKNRAAIRAAAELAKQDAAQVTLLHVIETIPYVEEDELTDFYETLRRRASRELATLAEPLSSDGIHVSEDIVRGKTAAQIVHYAIDQAIDLVVVSSHKIQLDQPPRGLASVSYQVSILCQCPVLMVK